MVNIKKQRYADEYVLQDVDGTVLINVTSGKAYIWSGLGIEYDYALELQLESLEQLQYLEKGLVV